MLAPRQRSTGKIAEEPDEIILFANGNGENVPAVQRRHDIGDAWRVRFGVQMADGGILRLQFDGIVFRPADLQNVAVVAGVDAVVAVLLAAEFGELSGQTVMRLQDLRRRFRRGIRP